MKMKNYIWIGLVFFASIATALPASTLCDSSNDPCCQKTEQIHNLPCCGQPQPISPENKNQKPDSCQCHFESGNDTTLPNQAILPTTERTFFPISNVNQTNTLIPTELIEFQYSRPPPTSQLPLYLINKQLLL